MTPNKPLPLPLRWADFWLDRGNRDAANDVDAFELAEQYACACIEALRQSQSLPAGAVAGLVDRLESTAAAYPKDVFAPLTVAQRAKHGEIIQAASAGMGRHLSPLLAEAANALRALQSDAREKGEAVAWQWRWAEGPGLWFDCTRQSFAEMSKRTELYETRALVPATHPAQASEADHGWCGDDPNGATPSQETASE